MNYFIEGLTLGLATGISCAVFCIPVFLGLTSRSINNITPTTDLLFFLSGRFVAYILVGIIFSVIGMQFDFVNIIEFVSRIFIATLLMIWGIRGFIESDKEKSDCRIKKYINSAPFIAGILTGISPCPPFIVGITRVFAIGNISAGVLYFLGFYLTTSIFLMPSLAIRLVKYKKELKLVTSFLSIIFSIFFIFYGFSSLLGYKIF